MLAGISARAMKAARLGQSQERRTPASLPGLGVTGGANSAGDLTDILYQLDSEYIRREGGEVQALPSPAS